MPPWGHFFHNACGRERVKESNFDFLCNEWSFITMENLIPELKQEIIIEVDLVLVPLVQSRGSLKVDGGKK